MAQTVKNPPAVQETQVRSLGQEDSPQKKERQSTPIFLPGKSRGRRLWPMRSQRVGHDWVTFTFTRKLKVPARWVYSQDQLIPSSHANQHAAAQWCFSPADMAVGLLQWLQDDRVENIQQPQEAIPLTVAISLYSFFLIKIILHMYYAQGVIFLTSVRELRDSLQDRSWTVSHFLWFNSEKKLQAKLNLAFK